MSDLLAENRILRDALKKTQEQLCLHTQFGGTMGNCPVHKENERLRELVQTYANMPFPCHDHMTEKQWKDICHECIDLSGEE